MSVPGKIVVYSKNACPHCDFAKELLRDLGLPYEEVRLHSEDPSYPEKRDALIVVTNHKTFPQIFVGDVFVGGAKELQNACDTLKLHDLCEAIGYRVEVDF